MVDSISDLTPLVHPRCSCDDVIPQNASVLVMRVADIMVQGLLINGTMRGMCHRQLAMASLLATVSLLMRSGEEDEIVDAEIEEALVVIRRHRSEYRKIESLLSAQPDTGAVN